MAGRFPAETLARGSREITTGPARAVPIMNHIITAALTIATACTILAVYPITPQELPPNVPVSRAALRTAANAAADRSDYARAIEFLDAAETFPDARYFVALEGGRESEVIGFTTEAEARAAIANNR